MADRTSEALEDLLLRAGGLADTVPEMPSLTTTPSSSHPPTPTAVDVKIRLAPLDPAPPPGSPAPARASTMTRPPNLGSSQLGRRRGLACGESMGELRSDGER